MQEVLQDKVETVAVVDQDSPFGYRLINRSDFDPKAHKEHKGKLYASLDEAKTAKGGKTKKG